MVLTKRIAERVLDAEMDTHLGYAKHAPQGKNTGNYRNGKSAKTVRSVHGDIELEVPRDRNSTFEPQRAKKGGRQLQGFDDRIVSLYARGMSTRDIQAHFAEVYGVEVSATFISQVTNAVMEEVTAWQSPWFIWMRWSCVAVPLRRCSTRPFIWRWASIWMARKSAWGCGWHKPKGPSSGYR